MGDRKIEKAPVTLDIGNIDQLSRLAPYLKKYGATDSKGRYLHWDQFKWRVPKGDCAEDAWLAVKFNRKSLMKTIELCDQHGKPFRFCVPDSLQGKLHKVVLSIGGNVGSLHDDLAEQPIQQRYLISSLFMEEAISSAQLEGALTTRRVAKEMLESERKPVNEDEQMIFNNYLLIKEAKYQMYEPLTVDLILEFHRLAVAGTTVNSVVPGQFRNDDRVFVADGIDGKMVYQPPSHKLIPERIQALCDFANKDHSGENGGPFIDPVIKAVILHFMIGYEHPFSDGNGRTARALFYWYLMKKGYEVCQYISISKLLKEAPIQYGKSYLQSETDENDLTYFIDYQVNMTLKATQALLDHLKRKTEEFHDVMKWLKHSKFKELLNVAQRDIVKKAIKTPGRIFTAKEVKHDFNISENSARKYLNELVTLKLLAKYKEGKTIHYIAPENVKSRL